ncbi:MAG: aldehyde dehydrogenase family protein [Polyangiaceae bacterium]
MECRAPASGKVIGVVARTAPSDVADVVARARRAQESWRNVPLAERAKRVLRFRDAIAENDELLVETISRECGKPRHEALVHEVWSTLDLATYYCKHATRILADEAIDLHLFRHRQSYVRYEARGVVGIVAPWNFPFWIPMADVFAALVTGNAVVVKPSEVTPLSMQKALDVYRATGLPDDLFAVIQGGPEVGEALVASDIQKLVFTGSVAVGKKVAAACGAKLLPCVLELGGKAPLVARADADVDTVARAIVFGAFANSGQACISVERVYVHETIHDDVVAKVVELVRGLKQGDPSIDYVDLGAITFPRQVTVARDLVLEALDKGAVLAAGGIPEHDDARFVPPTVLTHVDHGMRVMKEEIFGPVVAIMKVRDDDEAVALANDSHLGLNAYVYSGDREAGRRLAERIEAGSVVVNDVLVNHAAVEAPFFGIKQSGLGRTHGDAALRDMAEARHVNVERSLASTLARALPLAAPDAFGFPYSAGKLGVLRRAMELLYRPSKRSGRGLLRLG